MHQKKAENNNNGNDSNLHCVRSTTENEDITDDKVSPPPQNEEHSQHSENKENANQNLKVKTNDVIDFMNDNNEHCIARIIGPAGKSTGKYKTCKNIEYEAPGALPETKTWIGISTLENLSVNQPIPPNKQSDLNIENNLLPTEEI